MLGQQHWQHVRQASRLKAAWFFLIVVGSCSLLPPVHAEPGFTRKSIQGTWAFSATGVLPTPSTPTTMPFALVGLLTFERGQKCAMTFTINAGGQSWSSSSDTCTFQVHPDGSGTLEATFETGDVPFPPLALAFVIVNDDEILAIRSDTVVASGVLRRQIK